MFKNFSGEHVPGPRRGGKKFFGKFFVIIFRNVMPICLKKSNKRGSGGQLTMFLNMDVWTIFWGGKFANFLFSWVKDCMI